LIAQIELKTGLGEGVDQLSVYCIAEHLLLTDVPINVLGSYTLNDAADWSGDPQIDDLSVLCSSPITYAGKGWIGNAWRDVECRRSGNGYYLQIADLASFWIAGNGNHILLIEADPGCSTELLAETALGAPLMLTLALQGVYSLHVSVVRIGEQLVAFAGESGQGKTTLARFLGFESGPGWQRIIDDTLPFRINGAGDVEALPHFPQLKIEDALQPVHLIPPRAQLSALYILNTDADEVGVQIEPFGRSAAALAVVQHTVASRLFDHQLLAQHLAFCDAFSAGVPVRQLKYPRRIDHLPLVRKALAADLGLS
jgi:hypothetical protein